MSKTPKTPKCHLNGTFWHFVKSEPPGPAFFRFQGVPRDPILRPKSGVDILNVKKYIFIISIFTILRIFVFLHLWYFVVFHVLVKLMFCDMAWLCNVIRPYCNYREESDLCVVVLPSFCFDIICLWFVYFMSGRFHRRGVIFYTLVLPSAIAGLCFLF